MKTLNAIEIAVTLNFLIDGFWNYVKENKTPQVLDVFPFGGDGLVYGCYPLAIAIEVLNLEIEQDRGCPGVYHYEAIEEIAGKVLYEFVIKEDSLPNVFQFIGRFKPLLEKWYEGE